MKKRNGARNVNPITRSKPKWGKEKKQKYFLVWKPKEERRKKEKKNKFKKKLKIFEKKGSVRKKKRENF
jgi:hypothetical protein